MAEPENILDVPLSDTVRLQFKDMTALQAWILGERRFWSDLYDALSQSNYFMRCQKWWQEQNDYMGSLQDMIMKADLARPYNATQIAAIGQELQKMEINRPDRFLCSAIESDGFLKGYAITDREAVEAGLVLRRGAENMRRAETEIESQYLPSVRDAQARFAISLQQHLSLKQQIEAQKKMKSIEIEQRAAIAVRGLVNHWANRANAALMTALICLGTLAGLAGYILYKSIPILADLWHQLMQPSISGSATNASSSAATAISTSGGQAAQSLLTIAPFFVLVAIPVIWLMRHISRLFIENLADHRDATLRATMASAYITMLGDDKMNPQKDERAVILAALFRPSTAQPADESVPLPLLELFKGRN